MWYIARVVVECALVSMRQTRSNVPALQGMPETSVMEPKADMLDVN